MNDIIIKDYLENERLREDVERALTMKRLLDQSAKALFGETKKQPEDHCAAWARLPLHERGQRGQHSS